MIIEKKKISDLQPAPYNPRKSNEKEEADLKKSLEKFGVVEPIVFNKQTGYIVGGHFRVRELKKLGYKEVECVIVDLNEDDEKELNIRLNANTGQWDWEDLANKWDWDVLEDWGLDRPEWDNEEVLEAEEDDFDTTPPEEPKTVLGDLYEIGSHRLLCGDSTDSDQVAKLMNGEKADMVFTDPPYDFEDDSLYASNIEIFTENAHVFVMHDDKGLVNYLKNSSLQFNRFFVSDFKFASPRGNDPYLRHILISHQKNGNAITHQNFYDGFSSIIKMDYRKNIKDEIVHDHQKDVGFLGIFVKHYSEDNALILDLFLGGGSTMVASHQLKRRCYGLELDPKYCDVIVKRMIALDKNLKIKLNGKEIEHSYFD